MAEPHDFCGYLEKLEGRLRALEAGGGNKVNVACGAERRGADPTATLHLPFTPSKVAIYPVAEYTVTGGLVEIRRQGGWPDGTFIWVAVG